MKLIRSHLYSLVAATAILIAVAGGYVIASGGDKVTPVFAQKLTTIPGKKLTVVTVDYAPGGISPSHRHASSAEIFAYVVSGSIRSKVNDGAERVYKAGDSWYEPPNAHHSISANASATEPARILAVIIADDGATLTTYER